MTAEEMIQLNNERRKQLYEENKNYYENMLVYLRLSSIPEKKTEELLLEMLDHLLIAQQEGRSAEDVFGKDPEAYCKEVVQSIGNQSLFSFNRFAFVFGIGLYIVFILDGIFRLIIDPWLNRFIDLPPVKGFSVDNLFTPIFMSFIVDIILLLIKESTFKKFSVRALLGYVFPIMIVYCLPLILYFFLKEVLPVIPIPAWASLLIGFLLLVIHKVVFKRVDVF
jgi:DNA-binding ferritin-like protein (Dps family)